MAYIYNSNGQILAATNDTVTSGQLNFYDVNATPGLLPVTLGFERIAPSQLVFNICPRVAYLLRVALPPTVPVNSTGVTAGTVDFRSVTAVRTASIGNGARLANRAVSFKLPSTISNSGITLPGTLPGFAPPGTLPGTLPGFAPPGTLPGTLPGFAPPTTLPVIPNPGYYYLGANLTLTVDRILAVPFNVTATLAGRIVFDSPFRGTLAGQQGIFTLEQDLTNYAAVGYTAPLPLSLSSCQSCGCPPQFDCTSSGACVYNPNVCNGICNGRCYGLCPRGSFCNLASNGLYSCISDVGNSWFWFWLFFLIFLVLLIIVIAIIAASTSKKPMTATAAAAAAAGQCGCVPATSAYKLSESLEVT